MTAGEQLAEQLVEAISPYEDQNENWEGQGWKRPKKVGIQRFNGIQPPQGRIELGFHQKKLGFLPAQSHKAGFHLQKAANDWGSKMTVCTARNNLDVVEA